MMTILFLSFISIIATADGPLGLDFQGQSLKTLSPEQISRHVPAEALKVYEPQEKRQKNYRGFDVFKLLQNIHGKNLDEVDTVSFYCEDGYRADIPLSEFKTKKALLAYAMEDESSFTLKSPKGEIYLAPYYLVWDHPDAEAAAKDVYRWPYAVTKIDVIQSSSAYKKLQPLPEFEEGRDLFMKHCFSCHTLNDVGGHRGPPLTPFFLSQVPARLEGYALNPKKYNKNSQMSGLSLTLKDRKKVAKKIVAYGKKTAKL